MVDTRMDELVWLRNQLEVEGNDLLREMVRSFAQDLMSAEADVVCGAPWGQRTAGTGIGPEDGTPGSGTHSDS